MFNKVCLNNKVFVGDVFDRDTNIGSIYFKLELNDDKIYARELSTNTIIPLSDKVEFISMADIAKGRKTQFYVKSFGDLYFDEKGNIYTNNYRDWKKNLAVDGEGCEIYSKYFNYFCNNFDYMINSSEIRNLNTSSDIEEMEENNMDYSNNYKNYTNKSYTVQKSNNYPSACYEMNSRKNLTNVVGREAEIKNLIKVSCILGKSSILVGDAGVGKTAVVEGLVQEINNSDKYFLKDKIVLELNPNELVSGTKYRGEFEKKLEKIIEYAKENPDIILFIDEIHTLYGLGSSDESPLDATNVLKPYIERGDIIIIGATTTEEYNKTIANDKAFASRLTVTEVKSLKNEYIEEIIVNYIKYMEERFNTLINANDEQLNILAKELIDIANHQDIRYKILPIRLIKRIIEDAFAEAIYNTDYIVNIDYIINSILNSNEVKINNKFGYAEGLKSKLNVTKISKPKVLMLNR